jgi:hypothetical protein
MSTPPLPPEMLAYYAAAREAERLSLGHGPLEAERTRELLLRHLQGSTMNKLARPCLIVVMLLLIG